MQYWIEVARFQYGPNRGIDGEKWRDWREGIMIEIANKK
jgi:hypothetical protein